MLRIENLKTGKHAYAGLGFNKREEALDFKVALQDFETQLDREKNGTDLLSGPSKDLSIKEGEKIKIKIKTRGSDAPRRERKPKTVSAVNGGLSGPSKVVVGAEEIKVRLPQRHRWLQHLEHLPKQQQRTVPMVIYFRWVPCLLTTLNRPNPLAVKPLPLQQTTICGLGFECAWER